MLCRQGVGGKGSASCEVNRRESYRRHPVTTKATTSVRAKRDAFTGVAFWQLLAFVLLFSFTWLSEIADLPELLFGTIHQPLNWYRLALLSAGIITAAIVAVGHTYERQRTLVRQLVETCLYCHRVKTGDGNWQHVEEYFLQNFPIEMNKGACPDCEQMLASVVEKQSAISTADSK